MKSNCNWAFLGLQAVAKHVYFIPCVLMMKAFVMTYINMNEVVSINYMTYWAKWNKLIQDTFLLHSAAVSYRL